MLTLVNLEIGGGVGDILKLTVLYETFMGCLNAIMILNGSIQKYYVF
jgi:hypothetical protein